MPLVKDLFDQVLVSVGPEPNRPFVSFPPGIALHLQLHLTCPLSRRNPCQTSAPSTIISELTARRSATAFCPRTRRCLAQVSHHLHCSRICSELHLPRRPWPLWL